MNTIKNYKNDIIIWIGKHLTEHLDSCNEINCISLTDATMKEFDLYEEDLEISESIYEDAVSIAKDHGYKGW